MRLIWKKRMFEFSTLIAGVLMTFLGCGMIWLDFGRMSLLAGISGWLFYLLGMFLLIGFGAADWKEEKKPSRSEG